MSIFRKGISIKALYIPVVVLFFAMMVGCKQKDSSQQTTNTPTSPASQQAANATVKLPAPFGRHADDFDQILKRRNLRAIVVLNPTGFFYGNGHPMGITYEALRELETYINQREKTKALKVKVTFIPERPEQVQAALLQGVGDVIAYPVVVTPERQQVWRSQCRSSQT